MVVILEVIKRPIQRRLYETYMKLLNQRRRNQQQKRSQATNLSVVHYSQWSVSALICVRNNLDHRRPNLDKDELRRLGEFQLAML